LLEEHVKIALGVQLNTARLETAMRTKPSLVCVSKNFHPGDDREVKSIRLDVDAIQRDENIVQVVMVHGSNNKHFGWFVWKSDLSAGQRLEAVKLAESYNKSLSLIHFEYF
jgi:hypothetical protein